MITTTLLVVVAVIIALLIFIAVNTAYQKGYDDGHHSGWKGANGPELRPPGEPQRGLPYGITNYRN